MPMQPDREIINSWMGLTIDWEGIGPVTLTRLMAIGAEMVVYAAADAGGDEKWVIKFPRNHIGFVLGLPPNVSFKLHDTIYSDEKMVLLTVEEYEKEQKYNMSLSQRLYALRASPLLTEIFPLDLVWMRLANTLMEAANLINQSLQSPPEKTKRHFPFRRSTSMTRKHANEDSSPIALLSKYSAILRCKFIRNVLVEWSSVDTTSSESDMPDPFLTIITCFRPILVALPSQLAHDATRTLQELDALLDQLATPETDYTVENNPFLPYVAALIVGYNLPEKAVIDITEMLKDGGAKIYLQQLGQLFHVIGNDADFLSKGVSVPSVLNAHNKMAFVNLLAQVMNIAPTKELVEGIVLFNSEVLAS